MHAANLSGLNFLRHASSSTDVRPVGSKGVEVFQLSGMKNVSKEWDKFYGLFFLYEVFLYN